MPSSQSLWRNSNVHYGNISRTLHWLMVVLILFMLCLGWSLDLIPKEWKPVAMSVHKSLGISTFLLVIFRLVWRWNNAQPQLPQSLPSWQKIISVGIHYLLYMLLLAMPLSGWAMSSAFSKPLMFLGILQLPDLVPVDRELGKSFKELHDTLGYLLAATITLHAAAAFYHHFIRKDGALLRMWPIFLK